LHPEAALLSKHLGVLPTEICGGGSQLLVGFRKRVARAQTAGGPEDVGLLGAVGRDDEWQPELPCRNDFRHLKRRAENADHAVRLATHQQLPAYEAGISAEPLLPKAVAQHGHGRTSVSICVGRSGAVTARLGAQLS